MTSTLQTTRKAGKFSRYFCSLWLQSFCWYMLGVRVSFAYCQWLLWMVCWVKKPNYKFMAEVVFSYCLALHVFWARVGRNNSTAINVSKTKFSPLFFGLNMPCYMETCMRDSFVHLPRVRGWFYIRGQKQENNDVDPKLCLMWRNVCRCIDKLEKVISAILKFKKKRTITDWLFLFLSLVIMMWWGHFHSILLRGALVVAAVPRHRAWTLYSHVCFTRPRCEHTIHKALVSFLPSPQNLQSEDSWTVENEDSDGCVSVGRVLLLMGDSHKDGPGSLELVDRHLLSVRSPLTPPRKSVLDPWMYPTLNCK